MSYKFLVSVENIDFMDDLHGPLNDVDRAKLYYVQCSGEMVVVECAHEMASDNMVDIGEYSLLRALNGDLFWCVEILPKIDVINMFE